MTSVKAAPSMRASRRPAPVGSAPVPAKRSILDRFFASPLSGYLAANWYGQLRGAGSGDNNDEILCVAPTTAGFVIHVRNSGPETGSGSGRYARRHSGEWVAYDGTPG